MLAVLLRYNHTEGGRASMDCPYVRVNDLICEYRHLSTRDANSFSEMV